MTQPIPEQLTWHQDGYGDSSRHSGEIDAQYGDDHYPLSNATAAELRWLQEQADLGGDYAASKVIRNERYKRARDLKEELYRQ